MREYIDESKDMLEDEHFIGIYNKEFLDKKLSTGREQRKYNEGLEKGEKRGIQKGRKEGILEGEQKGILKGITETAKAMLKDGLSIDKIMEYTNLTKEQIEKLV